MSILSVASAQTTVRIIEDHKPLVDDLRNTGNELMDMCGDDDASDVKDDVDSVRNKYDDVKAALRQKLNALDDAFRNVTSEAGDAVDGLLEELHYLHDQVEHADPVAANPEAIGEQIQENNVSTVTSLDAPTGRPAGVCSIHAPVNISFCCKSMLWI